ncbi:hypothetical protein TNCV_616261 [Trichonephila clavipes]|nr:hypothetical protein TNCV_616261 [Trichonephila clavipes]
MSMTKTNACCQCAFTAMSPYTDAMIRKTWIHLKKWRLAIRASRFVVDYTIEDALVCDEASGVATTMVSELRVHTVANVGELVMQTFVVLQTTRILESVHVTSLHDQLRQCGQHSCFIGF